MNEFKKGRVSACLEIIKKITFDDAVTIAAAIIKNALDDENTILPREEMTKAVPSEPEAKSNTVQPEEQDSAVTPVAIPSADDDAKRLDAPVPAWLRDGRTVCIRRANGFLYGKFHCTPIGCKVTGESFFIDFADFNDACEAAAAGLLMEPEENAEATIKTEEREENVTTNVTATADRLEIIRFLCQEIGKRKITDYQQFFKFAKSIIPISRLALVLDIPERTVALAANGNHSTKAGEAFAQLLAKSKSEVEK